MTATAIYENAVATVQRFGGAIESEQVPCYQLKGRFEFLHDSVQILKRLRGTGNVLVDTSTFTIDIQFLCDWEIIEEVVADLKAGPELHVFVESLKLLNDYDGERTGIWGNPA